MWNTHDAGHACERRADTRKSPWREVFCVNLYFLFFSAYALLITPITVRWSLRLGRRSGYRVRVQAAGLPFVRKREDDDPAEERPIREQDVAESLASADRALLRAALDPRVRQRALRCLRLQKLFVYARFSFEDACATALCYAAARTAVQTLALCHPAPGVLSGRVEADFHAKGSEVLVRGIVGARLGSLGLTAILFGAAFIRQRGRQSRAKEEQYATASH